jgi:hypothetical protein
LRQVCKTGFEIFQECLICLKIENRIMFQTLISSSGAKDQNNPLDKHFGDSRYFRKISKTVTKTKRKTQNPRTLWFMRESVLVDCGASQFIEVIMNLTCWRKTRTWLRIIQKIYILNAQSIKNSQQISYFVDQCY